MAKRHVVRKKRRLQFSWMIALPLVGLFAAAHAPDQPQWKGTIVKEGDVTVVRNPRGPLYATPAFSFHEDYVLGGEGAESRYVLSHPFGMALDEAGNLYVVDLGEKNIKVFDKSGAYVRTMGRPGQGPGEYQAPTGLCVIEGRQELFVFDIQRISVLSLAGSLLRRLPLKGLSVGLGVDDRGDLFISEISVRTNETTIRTYSPDLTRQPAVVLTYQEAPGKDPFRPRVLCILDRAGHVVFGDSKTYEIRIIDGQGRTLKKIRREYDPVRATQAERDDLAARTKSVLGPEAAKRMVFSAYHSAFRGFFVDDAGHLFVETWERTGDGRQDLYDVFDADGRYVARVPLNPHPDFLNPLPRLIRNGKLYTIEPDAKGYEVVKRYSVKWNI